MIKVSIINDRIGRVIDFCERIEQVLDIPHELRLIPIDAPFLNLDHCGYPVIASFCATSSRPNELSEAPYMLVCTDYDDFEEIKDSIAHELVHYEQWRDGKSFTERGVAVRSRNILKLMEDYGN